MHCNVLRQWNLADCGVALGEEVAIYGWIEGATWHSGDQYRRLQKFNEDALGRLPEKDTWPWLVRGSFALPALWPQGTYRCQAIHFGLTLKDEPISTEWRDVWIAKFEAVLRRLYWFSATVHILRVMDPNEVYRWKATQASIDKLCEDPPEPISGWHRSVENWPRENEENPAGT
jgi:hypothetical protein